MNMLVLLAALLMPSQLDVSEYDISVGYHSTVHGSYNVAIGDRLTISGGECHVKVGHVGPGTRRLLWKLRKTPDRHLAFETAAAIETHCGYPRGYIDGLINGAMSSKAK